MEFFKSKWGLAAVIISLGLILAVLWFCLFGLSRKEARDGTLVRSVPAQEVVVLCRQTV